jgi:DNA-binding response OmpR family regulator
MRILVIEDEAKMAALIRRVLVAEHHAVDVAGDGVSGLGLAEGSPYDVAVVDRMLPDIAGTDVVRLMRAKGITSTASPVSTRGRTTTSPSRSPSPNSSRASGRWVAGRPGRSNAA